MHQGMLRQWFLGGCDMRRLSWGRHLSLAREYEKSSRYWGVGRKEQGSFDSLHLGQIKLQRPG